MQTTLEKETTIQKKEACSILGIKLHTLKNLTNKNIIIEQNKEVTLSSVLEYKKELDERRNITQPSWISYGGCG
jgi:hypothetical protein